MFKTDGKKKVKKDKWRRQSLTKYSVAICCVFGNFCCFLNKQNTVVIITLYLFDISSRRHLWNVLTFWWEFTAVIICWLVIIVILIKLFTENQWLVRFVLAGLSVFFSAFDYKLIFGNIISKLNTEDKGRHERNLKSRMKAREWKQKHVGHVKKTNDAWKKIENYVQMIFYKTLLRFFFAFPN